MRPSQVIGAWGYRDERQSWTWPGAPNATSLTVRAYGASGCVRLRLNGRPVDTNGGSSSCVPVAPSTDFVATLEVAYEPGELEASLHASATDLAPLAIASLKTAGPAAALRLTADRTSLLASRDDLSYVRAELIDAAGERVDCGSFISAYQPPSPPFKPVAWCSPVDVAFEVAGDAELAAVGSGDPLDVSSFLAGHRYTYRGLATAIVRPGKTGASPAKGTVRVTASAAGLKGAVIELTVG